MPSDLDPAKHERWLDRTWLQSQGLGVACGLSSVVLLGVGSFVLVATADGASRGIAMDDLRGFFREPRLAHTWLYLLALVFGVYALNTALATYHSVSRKLAAGVRTPASYGPAVLHVAFLIALLAHLVGGFFSVELDPVLIAGSFTPLGDGREARVVQIERESLPSGMPKTLRAHLEVRREGRVERAVVGYNEPLSEGFGARLFLMADAGDVTVARLRLGDATCALIEQGSCDLAGHRVELARLVRGGSALMAMVRVRPANGGPVEARRLLPGLRAALSDGGALLLEGWDTQPAVALRGRRAPGNPWALGSAVLLALGLAMMARRFVPRDARVVVRPEGDT